MIDQKLFMEKMTWLLEWFQRSCNSAVAKTDFGHYYTFLGSKLSNEQFLDAVQWVWAHETYFPPAATFLRAVGAGEADEAEIIWSQIVLSMEDRLPLRLSSQAVFALRQIGGLREIEARDQTEKRWLRLEFERYYRSAFFLDEERLPAAMTFNATAIAPAAVAVVEDEEDDPAQFQLMKLIRKQMMDNPKTSAPLPKEVYWHPERDAQVHVLGHHAEMNLGGLEAIGVVYDTQQWRELKPGEIAKSDADGVFYEITASGSLKGIAGAVKGSNSVLLGEGGNRFMEELKALDVILIEDRYMRVMTVEPRHLVLKQNLDDPVEGAKVWRYDVKVAIAPATDQAKAKKRWSGTTYCQTIGGFAATMEQFSGQAVREAIAA